MSSIAEAINQVARSFTGQLVQPAGDGVDPAAIANLPRLQELKTTWDPDNFFRQNMNILPRAAKAT